jgi:hypothetical protein
MHGSVALVQGLYFLMTGLWPLVSIGTFQQVTGPKINLWLVNTVGVLVAVIGAALILAGVRGKRPHRCFWWRSGAPPVWRACM